MQIVITGGLGFVGSHLAEEFSKNGHKITILTKSFDKISNLKSQKQIQIEKINVTNFQKLGDSIDKNKPDLIVHLAGETSHFKSFENPIDDIDSNSKSTLFLLEKIKNMKKKCAFVLGSTFIVVGRPNKLPVTEDTPCNPTTLYGTNRLASEFYCKIYHNVYGINTKIFRITNSFGPREQTIPKKNAVNYLIHEAFDGKNITIYNEGKIFRDLIYITDVVSGIKTIVNKGKPGELYWISSSKKTWFYQLGNLLEKMTDAKVSYIETPSYTKKVDVGNFVVSNKKLKNLGWAPKVDLKTGIQNTLDFFELSKNS